LQEVSVAKKEAERIRELVDGMMAGDRLAMEAFFTFIDGLKAKKLGKDGESALSVVVTVIELLLPVTARVAFAAASEREKKEASTTTKARGKEERSLVGDRVVGRSVLHRASSGSCEQGSHQRWQR
jgi:hypothetical protein